LIAQTREEVKQSAPAAAPNQTTVKYDRRKVDIPL